MDAQAVPSTSFLKRLKFKQTLLLTLLIAVLAGVTTGYSLSKSNTKSNLAGGGTTAGTKADAKHPAQDRRTFRDFAEGKVTKRPEPSGAGEYQEGTHLLMRQSADPVALTSSVVDLSQYEGKKIKVYGETQKAIKEGWLMDVGRVEELK